MADDNSETLRMIGELKGELGEVRGQLRELVHLTNNLRQSLEAQSPSMYRVQDLIRDMAALDTRVMILEAKENQRIGAMTLGNFIFKSPLVGWLIAASAVGYAFVVGV